MDCFSSEMAQETQVRLPNSPRSSTASEISLMQDDTFELVGSGGPDTALLTTSNGTSEWRPGGWPPARFAGRGSLSVEPYQTDSIPQISPSGRLAQMSLSEGSSGGAVISPMISEFCPLEEECGGYEYDKMMFPPVSGQR